MSAGANAFNARAGFNQSGGGHFMVLSALQTGNNTNSGIISVLSNPGSNSGGAFSNPTLSTVTIESVLPGLAAGTAPGYVAAAKMLKDMGRTVVSAGRTFRKFAPVVPGLPSTFGVVGQAGATPNAGFGSFYLEVGREGAGTPAPVVRYF
jgi:hypothetical protein